MSDRRIVAGGKLVSCDAEVRSLAGTPYEVTARRKMSEVRAVVWHWTGGAGDAKQVMRTLSRRGLCVNFVIDRDGVIWQCCDADRMTAHAGGPRAVHSANPWAVGVEVCGRGGDGEWWTPAQMTAGKALMRALSRAFGLPEWAHPSVHTLTRDTLERVRGHIGHFHVAKNKSDPGTAWMRTLCTDPSPRKTICELGP